MHSKTLICIKTISINNTTTFLYFPVRSRVWNGFHFIKHLKRAINLPILMRKRKFCQQTKYKLLSQIEKHTLPSDQNRSKIISFRFTHTYMVYVRWYLCPLPVRIECNVSVQYQGARFFCSVSSLKDRSSTKLILFFDSKLKT